MRVLITGITGFVGSHMAEFLLPHEGVEVFGIERWRSRTDNIDHLRGRVRMSECDIRDSASVARAIAEIRPDRIVHLAAQSHVPTSWNSPSEVIVTNSVGQINLFEAIIQLGLTPRILVAGSSEEYGMVYEDELPIKETNPLRPLSTYAVSKITQDFLGFQYAQSYQMDVVRTRAFNHTGPRRGDVFASSNFAKQIALIEAGQQEPVIHVGNLASRRDFSDVRDIVRGYWLALEHGETGELYNLCSGEDCSIGEMLEILLGFASAQISIQVEPKRLRPSDVPRLRGDCTKFHQRTGWRTEIPLPVTLEDLLNYWRGKVRAANLDSSWMADSTKTRP